MKGEITKAETDKCYRVLNLLTLVSFAAEALENMPDDRPGAVLAGLRECADISRDLVGEVLDKIDFHLREARS